MPTLSPLLIIGKIMFYTALIITIVLSCFNAYAVLTVWSTGVAVNLPLYLIVSFSPMAGFILCYVWQALKYDFVTDYE